jgi:metal-dependent amidase/aminoacylase/carboxypeptidase family protein
MHLQTIVAREVDRTDFAVVTVSAFCVGDAGRLIPEEADPKIDVRAALPQTRKRAPKAIKTIIAAEAAASSNPIQLISSPTTQFPFPFNVTVVTNSLAKFSEHFGPGNHEYQNNIAGVEGSEDFGILAIVSKRPSYFFQYGGIDLKTYDEAEREGNLDTDISGHHSPLFAPVICASDPA